MIYESKPSSQFKKDLKACKKHCLNLDLLSEVLNLLCDGPLSPKNIGIILCMESLKGAANVIFCLIGFLSMNIPAAN